MKILLTFIAALLCIGGLVGCASTSTTEIGMDERAWRRHANDAHLVGAASDGERVWKSGESYYHFRDGKLARISGETQRVEVTLSE